MINEADRTRVEGIVKLNATITVIQNKYFCWMKSKTPRLIYSVYIKTTKIYLKSTEHKSGVHIPDSLSEELSI